MFFELRVRYDALACSYATPLRLLPNKKYFVVENASKSITLRLKKRDAYPVTYCHAISPDGFQLGYGPINTPELDESLGILVTPEGKVSIQRDTFVTLPLFFARGKDELIISNSYEAVYNALSIHTPSQSYILETLSPWRNLPVTTPVEEIRKLTERQTLVSDKHGLRITNPPSRSWTTSSTAPKTEPRYYRQVFDEMLDYFARTRLSGQSFAFEVSGGLDSSALPLFLGKHYSYQAPLATVWLEGTQRQTQEKKIRAISDYIKAPVISASLSARYDFPLSPMLPDQKGPLFLADHDLMARAFQRLTTQLRDQGVAVLCTGLGGDDILENIVSIQSYLGYGDSERRRRAAVALPPFVTDTFRQAYIAAAPQTPPHHLPLLPLSLSCLDTTNNLYIEYDIWPVSPFMQPPLYEFCQGIPAYLRNNKDIMRAWYHAHQFPEILYAPQQQEDFLSFFSEGFNVPRYEPLINELLPGSYTIKKGYVDSDNLLRYFGTLSDHGGQWLYSLYRWLVIEISCRQDATFSQSNNYLPHAN